MLFNLSSPAFAEGALIPPQHACAGEDLSPELHWGEPPPGTRSFALLMDDPDAPAGTWVHWVLWNVPADLRYLAQGQARSEALPMGALQGVCYGVASFDRLGYHGPCPPPGAPHRYYFRLYALDAALDLPARSDVFKLRQAMRGHVLGEAVLMGKFKR